MANAGDYVSVPIKDLSLGVVKKAIEANYYTFVSSALSFLSSFPKGIIVGIAGYDARFPSPDSAAYASAKTALMRFSESLRLELPRENYQVLTVLASTINTWSDKLEPGAMDRVEVAQLLLDATTLSNRVTVEELILVASPGATG